MVKKGKKQSKSYLETSRFNAIIQTYLEPRPGLELFLVGAIIFIPIQLIFGLIIYCLKNL